MVDEIFKEAFQGFKDELGNKKRFVQDWERYCKWGFVTGGKGQPMFPNETIGSFTTLLGVAQFRPLNHPKSIAKQGQYFTKLAARLGRAR